MARLVLFCCFVFFATSEDFSTLLDLEGVEDIPEKTRGRQKKFQDPMDLDAPRLKSPLGAKPGDPVVELSDFLDLRSVSGEKEIHKILQSETAFKHDNSEELKNPKKQPPSVSAGDFYDRRNKRDRSMEGPTVLGDHGEPASFVKVLSEFPTPSEFYLEYFLPSQPLIVKGGAKSLGISQLWTDKFLTEKHGEIAVNLTDKMGGVSNETITLAQFLKSYKKDKLEFRGVLPQALIGDMNLPPPLRCETVTDNSTLHANWWMCSGSARTPLFSDYRDSWFTVPAGIKRVVLIPPSERHACYLDGSVSVADANNLDLFKFPNFRHVQWLRASLTQSDALYIPAGWVRHVRSYGGRGLALSISWTPHSLHLASLSQHPHSPPEFDADPKSFLPRSISCSRSWSDEDIRAANFKFNENLG